MLGFRMAVAAVWLGLLAGLFCCHSAAAAKSTGDRGVSTPLIKPGSGLLRSHEFRSTLKALPHWTRVMNAAEMQIETFYACNENCSSAALSWRKIIQQAKGLSPIEQLKHVNSFFNRWPYRLDIDNYGVNEYWATPDEFLRLSGDCEDYSISKYYALRELGFPVEDLRIVLLRDNIRNILHAVLAVHLGDESYILDNMSDLVLSHLKYEHYVPQYSVNELYRWAHVSPKTMY